MHTDFLLHVYIYIHVHIRGCVYRYIMIYLSLCLQNPLASSCIASASVFCLAPAPACSWAASLPLSLSLSCLLGGALRLIFICFLALVAPLAAADSHILGQHAAAVFTCFLQIRHFCPSAWATTHGRIKMYSHLCRAGICTCIYSHCTSPVPLVLISTNYVVLTLVFYLL